MMLDDVFLGQALGLLGREGRRLLVDAAQAVGVAGVGSNLAAQHFHGGALAAGRYGLSLRGGRRGEAEATDSQEDWVKVFFHKKRVGLEKRTLCSKPRQ